MDWQSLLPPNSSQLERDLEASITDLLWQIPIEINKILRPDECPIQLLPWLAWALSVDQWDVGWLEATKRQVVAESFAIHQKKGTRWAIERLLEITGHSDVEIIEWWQTQPKGRSHTFYMKIPVSPGFDPVILSEFQYSRIRKVVDSVKPVRSQYRFSITSRFETIKPPQVIIVDDGSGGTIVKVDGSCPAEAGISIPTLVCQRDAKTVTETAHNFYCIPHVPTESGTTKPGNYPAQSISALPTNLLSGDIFVKPNLSLTWEKLLECHVSTQPIALSLRNMKTGSETEFNCTSEFSTTALFQPISMLNCEAVL